MVKYENCLAVVGARDISAWEVFIGEADQKLAADFMLTTEVVVFGAGVRASLHLQAPVRVAVDDTDPLGETASRDCLPLQERRPYS